MASPQAALNRPERDEYAPHYDKYVQLVPEGDITTTLSQQLESTLTLFETIDEAQARKRYAPDKWSIKELVGHVIDAERVFAYRAMRFARNDQTPLPAFEQDDYVSSANSDARQFSDLREEFAHVRRANIHFFRALGEEAWRRRGIASEVEVTVRALAYIIAGHEAHHVNILKQRYLATDSHA